MSNDDVDQQRPHLSGRAAGMYEPECERDNCGVGFIVRLDALPGHRVVQDAISVLVNLEHRGAVGGDEATGDGAGLLLQIPHEFFRHANESIVLPPSGRYGVGVLFLPLEPSLAARCRSAFESIVHSEGAEILGWRAVPTQPDCLGELARQSMPVIEQVFVGCGDIPADDFERELYVIRRLIEKRVASWPEPAASIFYVCSLSARTVVYKGMLKGSQLGRFYPDLSDERFACSFVVVHQRYSTNTLPTWSLAQPFRLLAHNGEINTLRGNINHMRAREAKLGSARFGNDLEKVLPVIVEGGSDSAIFDNVLELLVHAGRSLPHAALMMVPEAWGTKFHMSDDRRAFFEYHAAIMEPWDGPAALVFTDGRYIGATLDRNGLRPCRFCLTRDGLVVLASEAGVLDIAPERILRLGRLQPGKMLLVDLEEQRIIPDNEIKARLSRQRPYRRWVQDHRIELRGLFAPAPAPAESADVLLRKMHAFGYSQEELRMLLGPMASSSQEPVGSMGSDAALAVLSDRPQLLFTYFKQLFAQVTNPAIDPLRETLVMSLMSFTGPERNLLEETPEHVCRLKLHHPILTAEDLTRLRNARHSDLAVRDLDILFPAGGDGRVLRRALEQLFQQAEQAIAQGATILVLTDRHMDASHAAIPVLLATAGLHHHLIRRDLRCDVGLIVESGEVREIMHFALLIGYGASAICPTVAFATLRTLAEQGLLDRPLSPEEAVDNYITAAKKGLLKTFSRMGISTIRSYFGAQIFEAVGLNEDLVDNYFTGTASRVGGIGLDEVAAETAARHRRGYPEHGQPEPLLDVGGEYHFRIGGERHLWTPQAIAKLQQAVRQDDYTLFKQYSALMNDRSRACTTLRSLFTFKPAAAAPIEEVESVESILRRFCASAMSFGSLSKEAHETVAIAMNRLGARSNCGEGGEDPNRYRPLPTGEDRRSAIKQIASGRFGVTTEYCINCDELQIKIAQGAKPGEGGQLPGHKVTPEIARVRHTIPGVTLISPPPHHDIYSIEDLAQLIYDLRSVNPRARVSVKLVAEVGVGTIAAGVVKAGADMVLIAGHDGGTGASPLSAIKHVGLPWELGLAETQHTLLVNHLRDRIRIQVDGQLKTGRDLAIAALLGAEEFGFGTTILVSLGCVMARKCHLNTCPVGVATQDPTLRSRFRGRPEHAERFLRFVAQELREYMAQLGFRTLDEMTGHSELLDFEPAIEHWKSRGLDFTAVLCPPPASATSGLRCARGQRPDLSHRMDWELLRRAEPAIAEEQSVFIEMPIRNVDRTVGATLSGELVRRRGAAGLPDGTIQVRFRGCAGQSFGAFLAPGITFRLEGQANDYLGKGMSGGRIILVPSPDARLIAHENTIVGNTVLYGATGGAVYICGLAGERFAVRNSGAIAVVEGLGDHGCEYMTGGTVVVLGPTGYNFAAGMTGGIAYVFDQSELFAMRCNLDTVDLESVWRKEDRVQLRALVEQHHRFTGSARAAMLLENWDVHLPLFVKVMPIDYREALQRMRGQEFRDTESVSATEEVFHGQTDGLPEVFSPDAAEAAGFRAHPRLS